MLVKTYSAAVNGLDVTTVRVEVNIVPGVMYHLTGLGDTAVRESRDRIASALQFNGYKFPHGDITINLAPADLRKEGSSFDLPLAIAILAASGAIVSNSLDQYMMVGELGLDGTLQPIKGALPIAIKARAEKLKGLIVPKQLKSKIMSNIVANMGADGDENRDKDKQLIDEINEKADNIEGELIEIQKNIKAVNDRLMLLSMDYFSEKIEKNKLESKEIDDWIANIRVELKKNVIRKQNRDINNREIYSYLHDIFGAEVLDLFDIEYDDPMVFNANNANTDNANNENKGN